MNANNTKSMNFLSALRRRLAVQPGLIQSRLMDASSIQTFARERGVSLHSAGTITDLWQVGIVRADLVRADRCAKLPDGLERVDGDDEDVIFLDGRSMPWREDGFGGILAGVPLLKGVEPLFHPYRLFILHHIHRVFGSIASAAQFLNKPEGLVNIAKLEIEHLERWTKTRECAQRFEYWNHCCELALLADVVSHGRVYGYERQAADISKEEFEAQKLDFREALFRTLRTVPLVELERVRGDLVTSAEMVDGNKMLHVLIRLTAFEQRERLRDDIGAAMHYLAMAESIRRAVECALDRHLKEEDELGFGQWMEGARKLVYGSERILDSSPVSRRDFMSSMGLDLGPKVRCYVEGDTELAALSSAVGEGGSIAFINLRGQFAEARGRGLMFVESLATDMAAGVFSIIALDGDRLDNVRAVRKAAQEERMFGPFYVANPDFELENFTVPELVSVAIEVRREEGVIDLPNEAELIRRVGGITSGKEFFAALRGTSCEGIDKGERWGTALMKYALNNERLPAGHGKAEQVRQVIKIAQMILRSLQSGYLRSIERSRIDPLTGEVVPRVHK
jgi:hypothetical protein